MKRIERALLVAFICSVGSVAAAQYSQDFESTTGSTPPPEWSADPITIVTEGRPFGALTGERALQAIFTRSVTLTDPPGLVPGQHYRLTADVFVEGTYPANGSPGTVFQGARLFLREKNVGLWSTDLENDANLALHTAPNLFASAALAMSVNLSHAFVAGATNQFIFTISGANLGAAALYIDNVRIQTPTFCGVTPSRSYRYRVANPVQLRVNEPNVGGTFDAIVDLAATPNHRVGLLGLSNTSLDFTLAGGQVALIGNLLQLEVGTLFREDVFIRPVFFQLDIPNDAALCGVTIHAQAGALDPSGSSPFELSNAVDFTFGE